jgi:tetratricopeptide (TPR) repeat protein
LPETLATANERAARESRPPKNAGAPDAKVRLESEADASGPPLSPTRGNTAEVPPAAVPGGEKTPRPWKTPVAAALAALLVLAAGYFYYGRGDASQPRAKDASAGEKNPLLAKAQDYYQEKNHKRAMVAAKELLSLEPGNAGAQVLVGRILIAEERPREAIEAVRQALDIDPNLTDALAVLGQAHLLSGQWGEALAASRKALIRDPALGLPYRVIGEVYLLQGREDDSIAVFEEARKLLPPHVDLLQKLGGAYIRNKDFPKAQAVLTDALKLDPGDASVHFNLARVYAETGNGPAAIRHMEMSERLYTEGEQTFWAAKARHNKLAIVRLFHMTPDSITP